MGYMGRVTMLLAVALLVPAGSAAAASGGAGLVSARSPSGIVKAPNSSKVFARVLREGVRGADVKTLQTWLSDLGYSLPVTGYFGSLTQTAVKNFQRAHHLSPASGTVGRKTAACVLLFAFGMLDVPVDTPVSRVSTRLGLLRPLEVHAGWVLPRFADQITKRRQRHELPRREEVIEVV